MSASDGNDIQLHEQIFAQVLGVEENEEFATELTYYAADLLQILPPGWIVEVGEGELAGIPLFVYTDTDETEWNHPYESEYRRRIQSRRNELYDQLETNNQNNLNNLNAASILSGIEDDAGTNNLDFNASAFNASSIATDFTETGPAVFDVVPPVAETPNEDEASESPVASDQLQDYEILFAQVLGVKLDEKQFLPLAYLAKELLKIVPEGWELLLSTSATGVRVPYYYEQATRSSHWIHPYENQYKDLIDKKRQDLLANAADSPSPALSPIPTPMSTARSFVSESSINSTDRMALIEAMFAGAVGISPFEEFASELGDFAKELLMTLPAGWEVVIADSGKTTEVFPLFVNTLDNSSQLEHPMLNEHTQSIEEMRTTLLYGVLPSEFSQYDEEEPAKPGAGAGAEPSAEFLAQEAARQAEEEDIARSIATVKSFEARIAEAERVAAERAAADQRAKEDAEAIAKVVEKAPTVVKTEAELKAELKAQRKAERIRQNEEDQAAVKEAVRHAQIAREQAEQALKEAQAERIAEEEAEAQAEARRVQGKQAEELRLKEIADQIEAEARATAEEAEIAEKQALLQEKLAAEIRAEEEEEALAEAARKEVEAQHEAELAAERAIQEKIEAELAAQRAIEEEKQRIILCEQEAAEAAIRIIQEAEIEVAEEFAAAEVARIAEEARLAEEARREEERIAEEKRLEEERAALAILAAERLEVLKGEAAAVVEMAIAMAMEKIESVMHESSAPILVSTAETVITEGWVMSPPVPGTPMDASVAFWGENEEQDEKNPAAPAEQVVVPELTEEELEAQRVADLDAAVELATIEAEVGRIVDETVATLVPELALDSIEAVRQEIIDRERAIVEAREAEEREARERAERRIAQRKATEAAALEALRKAEEEERALEEAAKELFRKELELARQASFLSTARTEGEEGETSDGPAVTTTAEAAGEVEIVETGEVVQVEETDEPDELALTIPPGGIDFSLQPESPDSARLSHLSLQDTFALEIEPAISKEITSADLMIAAQNNAIRLKTQYLDHAKPTDKATRLTSKRNSVADTDKILTPKTSSAAMVSFAAKSNIDLRNASSDMEEPTHNAGEDSVDEEDSPHHKKDWKSKILRPLSKVSPKKEAQRRRRAASRHSPTRSLSPGRKERLWEMKGDEDEAAVEVGRMKWYRLGCYKTYEEAVKARKVVQKMVVSDSQGTIIVDPRIDISDADLVATLNQTLSFDTFRGAPTGSRGIASAGAGATGLSFTGKLSTGPGSRASTASPTFHRSAGAGANAVASLNANNRSLSGFVNNNSSSRPGTTSVPMKDHANTRIGTSHGSRLNSASPGFNSTQRSTLSSAPAGTASGPLIPAAKDTKELILGRVMRTTEKTSMLRVRKDLGRMQWVLETDDFEVNKITDRHRKKKGVDIEGKVENAVSSKAKRALKAMELARAENDDFATQTLKKLPAMDELLESNLLDVLATSKSFGTFTLTSQLIASERQLKEEVGKITSKMAKASASNKTASNGKNEPKSKDFSVSPSKKRGRSASPAVAAAKLTRADSTSLLMSNVSSKMNANSISAKKQEPASKLVLPEINRKTAV